MSKVWVVLVLGILLRLILSFSTFHPDIKALSDGGQFISGGQILNLYDFSSDALVLNYPPPIYWFFGLVNLLFNGNPPVLKLSYLFFDILLGVLLYKLVDSKKSFLAFSLWMFNPINLYATYMMGQFDVIPTFSIVLSIYLALKNKLNWAALALGGGIAFKLFPIFLIIPLIILANGIWKKAKLVILTLLPYCLSVIPYLLSESFRVNALFANQSSKSLYASIPVSGGESIILFPAFLIIFYLLIWKKGIEVISLWRIYLIPLLLFFTFTHSHPQWLIWITPFFILGIVTKKVNSLLPILLIFVSWFASLLFFDRSLTVGIFAPVFPMLEKTPDIWTLLNISIDYNFSRSLLQTIFASSAIYLIYELFPRKENG